MRDSESIQTLEDKTVEMDSTNSKNRCQGLK